jgi:hypothetical protein
MYTRSPMLCVSTLGLGAYGFSALLIVIEIGRFRVWLIVGIDGLWHDMQFIPNTATFRR